MDYKAIKEELKKRHKNIKGFTKAAFDIIVADRQTAADLAENGGDVQAFYRQSATSKTDFYINNGGAYCELISILAGY